MVKVQSQKRPDATSTKSDEPSKLLEQYGCGPVQFAGAYNALYERHLGFDNVMELTTIGARERFEAIARSVRGLVSQGDLECGRLGKILQRPHDCRICSRDLERKRGSGGMKPRQKGPYLHASI